MRTHRNVNGGAAVLWASAFVIAALVVVQAGRLPGHPAYAEMAMHEGEYSLVTANSGRGSEADPYELLYVIDNRDQVLLWYEIEDAQQRQVQMRGGASLPVWFANARH